jgi:hypothetical protein
MSVELKDEYATLRAEMMNRFERIFEIEKYGIGGVVALLAYVQIAPATISGPLALAFLEVMILFMGLAALNEFQAIYRIGTYIALVSERGSPAKWHRMSRKYPRYLTKLAGSTIPPAQKRLFPFGDRWGADSMQFAIGLLVLAALGVGACVVKFGSMWRLLNIGTGVLAIAIAYIGYALSWGMRDYRIVTEDKWQAYVLAWEENSFRDPYAAPVKSGTPPA